MGIQMEDLRELILCYHQDAIPPGKEEVEVVCLVALINLARQVRNGVNNSLAAAARLTRNGFVLAYGGEQEPGRVAAQGSKANIEATRLPTNRGKI
ncbi:hypothetical protein HYALB_00012577 [Hymenoscyphus albidus]|uniref:Uncharacterized protein n=1 Tax=Hymenoscyphus albidus TaxID=595503 RepID=A0A9N9LJH0_9HELO|nr:hypothetical protein HYALB_00012577 [Hymenoscyphus albidus]